MNNTPTKENQMSTATAHTPTDENFDINLDDALPEPENTPAPAPGNTATEAQLNFIKTLVQERAGDDKAQKLAQEARAQYAREEFSKASASHLIEALKGIPADWKRERDNRPDAPEGMHKLGDTIYKVQIAVHGSGKPYAKALRENAGDWYFEYAAGAVRDLSEDTLLPLGEAQAFGRLYGVCCACGRVLTDENSIEAGIGPICAGKF